MGVRGCERYSGECLEHRLLVVESQSGGCLEHRWGLLVGET